MKTQTNTERLTVLVVEDDPAVSRVLSLSLRSGGFEPVMARTGKQAMDLLSGSVVDAVVLDLGLPGGDGGVVLDAVRSRQQSTGVPYWVAISAMDPADASRRYRVTKDRFMAKPFNPWELVDKLRAGIAIDTGK